MTRRLFEYFFDPQELEPFYSELVQFGQPKVAANRRPRTSVQEPKSDPVRPQSVEADSSETDRRETPTASVSPEESVARNEGETDRDSAATGSGHPQAVDECEPIERPLKETDSVVTHNADTDARVTEESYAEPSPGPRSRVRRLHSVHALGQYVFCVRSAILAAEKGDERDIDEPPPRLTFLPNFDRERIEEMLSLCLKRFALACVLVLGLIGSMTLSAIEQKTLQFSLAALALFLGLLWSAHLMTCIVQLTLRRMAAIRAEAREPEPSFEDTQHVNWWSMLKVGFEAIRYQRQFQHPELPLEGSPWRVLQKGSKRIPVIRTGGDRLGPAKGTLYPKHEVRLVAYALLLEADGNLEVPYGLVFPADSPRGLAFAITDELRNRVVRLLQGFERKLDESQQGNNQPGLPDNRNRCANCDYGKPELTTAREVTSARKAGEQIVILQNRSDAIYHCDCGDRFGSAPPHRDAVRKGLRAVLE